jgi:hypothetical protein
MLRSTSEMVSRWTSMVMRSGVSILPRDARALALCGRAAAAARAACVRITVRWKQSAATWMYCAAISAGPGAGEEEGPDRVGGGVQHGAAHEQEHEDEGGRRDVQRAGLDDDPREVVVPAAGDARSCCCRAAAPEARDEQACVRIRQGDRRAVRRAACAPVQRKCWTTVSAKNAVMQGRIRGCAAGPRREWSAAAGMAKPTAMFAASRMAGTITTLQDCP